MTQARDGLEAIELLDTGQPFDLVLTDVVMPRLDGYCLRERCSELRPALPVLLMSGHASRNEKERGIDREVSIQLHKPFTPEELVEAIQTVLVGS